VCAACDLPLDPAAPEGHSDFTSFDHVTPLSAGGRNSITNLLLKHYSCNMAKGGGPASQSDLEWLRRVRARLIKASRQFAAHQAEEQRQCA
jgi:5-methylcytosine-specific restriction endonuclease McrA